MIFVISDLHGYSHDRFLELLEKAKFSDDDEYYEDIMTVFGHTPTLAFGEEYQNKVIHTKTWTAIDMGAGFGYEPVLVRLDDMTEFRLGG